jgi:hypothetical protein
MPYYMRKLKTYKKNDHTQTQLKEQLIQKDKILKELSDEKESLHRLYDLALKDLRELELVSLEKEKKIKNYVEVISSLKIDLRRKEQELQVLQDIRTQSLEKDKYIVRLMEAKAALETEVQKVRETPPQTKKISAARVELEQVIEFKNISIIQMKRLAINLALQSREFETFINSQNDIDLRFISNLVRLWRRDLRDLLNISPLEKITLFQLIEKAKDKNILTQGEACLANFLRIERKSHDSR